MRRSRDDRSRGVGGLGEFALIDRLARLVPTRGRGVALGVGDDAAVLACAGRMLATCDAQVEGVHFDLDLSAPTDVGWRALAVNLSDIAAMGGVPRYALVSLLLPRHAALRVVDGIYRGIAAAARAYGVAVAGGNVSRTPGPLAVDVTVLGDVGRALGRRGAGPGDGVWITGTVGKAAAGLFLLRHPDVRVPGAAALRAAYRRPVPRVAAGRALAAARTVTAAIDTSDGTASDVLHLAEASGVGVRLELARLPVPRGLAAAARRARCDPRAWTLGGGEDYELLFTARPSFARSAGRVAREAGVPLSRIGEVVPRGEGRWTVEATGRRTPLVATGWDHFNGRG